MRIYIADDNEEFANFLAKVATMAGWSVSIFGNGSELVAALGDGDESALLIIDINMPELDGIEVIEELQKIDRRLRLRFITGGLNANALAAYLIASARDLESGRFLTKPISIEAFRTVLEEEALELG